MKVNAKKVLMLTKISKSYQNNLVINNFSLDFNYYDISANILFTFLLYYLFRYLFDIYDRLVFKAVKND